MTEPPRKERVSQGPQRGTRGGTRTQSLDDGALRVKREAGSELRTLLEMFPSWQEEDLLAVLQDTHLDIETAVQRITEGLASQWGQVKSKKEVRKSKELQAVEAPEKTKTKAPRRERERTEQHERPDREKTDPRRRRRKDEQEATKQTPANVPRPSEKKPAARSAPPPQETPKAKMTWAQILSEPASAQPPVAAHPEAPVPFANGATKELKPAPPTKGAEVPSDDDLKTKPAPVSEHRVPAAAEQTQAHHVVGTAVPNPKLSWAAVLGNPVPQPRASAPGEPPHQQKQPGQHGAAPALPPGIPSTGDRDSLAHGEERAKHSNGRVERGERGERSERDSRRRRQRGKVVLPKGPASETGSLGVQFGSLDIAEDAEHHNVVAAQQAHQQPHAAGLAHFGYHPAHTAHTAHAQQAPKQAHAPRIPQIPQLSQVPPAQQGHQQGYQQQLHQQGHQHPHQQPHQQAHQHSQLMEQPQPQPQQGAHPLPQQQTQPGYDYHFNYSGQPYGYGIPQRFAYSNDQFSSNFADPQAGYYYQNPAQNRSPSGQHQARQEAPMLDHASLYESNQAAASPDGASGSPAAHYAQPPYYMNPAATYGYYYQNYPGYSTPGQQYGGTGAQTSAKNYNASSYYYRQQPSQAAQPHGQVPDPQQDSYQRENGQDFQQGLYGYGGEQHYHDPTGWDYGTTGH